MNEQLDAFNDAPTINEHEDGNLARVSARIGGAIIEFFSLNVGQFFFADDLRRFVTKRCGTTAPGSADRVMRSLRQKHKVNYDLIDRSRSLYLASRKAPSAQ